MNMKNLQQAADDAGTIAETVETLGKLLDRFHTDHGEELYARLERVFPLVSEFGGGTEKPIYHFAQQLTPSEI